MEKFFQENLYSDLLIKLFILKKNSETNKKKIDLKKKTEQFVKVVNFEKN